MALARVLARPFWNCQACRISYFKAFTTSSANELPRKVARRSPSESWPPRAVVDADDSAFPVFESEVVKVPEEPATSWSPSINAGIPDTGTIAGKTRGKWTPGGKNKEDEVLMIPSELLEEDEVTPKSRGQAQSERQERYAARQAEVEEDILAEPMSELPWYLQNQGQDQILDPDGPMAERQKLPDLPEHPPPMLQTLLTHLSIDIGLDYLTILDLRALDPPPALGANLMMIIGTARSEKHLDVSAGRFCRYLRSEYKVHPYADGRLGRNELKIKQRRKKKKATAMANAGAMTSPDDIDDGIRTGWVCVHAGYWDPALSAPRKEVVRHQGLIGFGEENNKVTLIIQMFTEEKRASVDLEGLWEGILKRNLRKQEYQANPETMDIVEDAIKAVGDEEDEPLTREQMHARRKFKLSEKSVLDEDDVHEEEETKAGEAKYGEEDGNTIPWTPEGQRAEESRAN